MTDTPLPPPLPPTSSAPVAPGERLQVLDVLRGLALPGILLMNLEAFTGGLMASMTGIDTALTGADRIVDALVLVLVQGKFYPLFALLFGMGFAVMAHRARGLPTDAFNRVYARRLAVLGTIGLAHAVLVWSGDILLTYALVGVLLLALRGVPTRALPLVAALSLAFTLGLLLLMGALMNVVSASGVDAPGMQSLPEVLAEERAVIATAGWWDALRARVVELGLNLAALPLFGGIVLAMFLLGRWAIERDVPGGATPRLLAWLRWGALPVGLLLTLASLWVEPSTNPVAPGLRDMAAEALRMLGGVLQALGYAAWVMRALAVPALARGLAVLAPAGRMALTLYLVQSVVCTFLFHAYGLGLPPLPRAWHPVFVLVLVGLQVAFAHAWFARFRFGPMEWVWRWATYGVRPPMRVGG